MCGRFVTVIPYEELKQIFDLVESQTRPEPRYNVAPTQQVQVVRSTGEHNVLDSMRWGLIPFWSKDASIASHTINARCETVAEKPAFRHAIKYNRCIIPISGFYEWTHTEGKKTQHYIYLSDHAPMSLAGIWEHWKNPEGQEIETFSILTTTSNSLIQPLHDRMPVILQPAAAARLLTAFRHAEWPVFHIQHESVRTGSTFFLPNTSGTVISYAVAPLWAVYATIRTTDAIIEGLG